MSLTIVFKVILYFCSVETIITDKLSLASEYLKAGELVAVPTETVYGLAANGLNPSAVKKIFEAKSRPFNNPLILHFANQEQIDPFILDFPPILKQLTEVFWPGPLTVLLPKSNLVDDLITGGKTHVAIRIPSHPDFHALLQQLDFPLAAPSANLYGRVSPTNAEHVYNQLKGKIPLILDGGPCEKGIESTIIGMENEQVIVYRLGSISIEEIALHLGEVPQIKNEATENGIASGMVKYHYAPRTPLYFYDASSTKMNQNNAYIFFKECPNTTKIENVIVLSETSDLQEAARKLYSALHEFDERGFHNIYIERFPEQGLGATLNDRLNRATEKFKA